MLCPLLGNSPACCSLRCSSFCSHSWPRSVFVQPNAAQPLGGCPENYDLVTVKYVLKNAGLEEPDASMDRNGDGWTCLKIVAEG
jgi:hypothetical protein